MHHENLLKNIPGYVVKEITPDQWDAKLGNSTIPGTILSSGHWYQEGHVPDGEPQKIGFDTYGCTVFGYTNRIEILWHRLKGEFRNFSDLALYVLAGIRPPGANPHDVAEVARHKGLVDEDFFPFKEIQSVDDIYQKRTAGLSKKAEEFLISDAKPQHDWVECNRESLKDELKRSPLGVPLPAWFRRANGLYYFPERMMPTHDTTLVDFEEGSWWMVFDSYPDEKGSYIKKIEWDAIFPGVWDRRFRAKRYWLAPPLSEKLNILQQIYRMLLEVLGLRKKIESIASLPELKLISLAHAIKAYENVNIALNNPGGLRWSPFQNGSVTQSGTGKKLATFATYEEGWNALLHQLKIVCNGTSPAYNAAAEKLGLPNCGELTLSQFLGIFAPRYENDTDAYINFIEARTGIQRSQEMKTLI